VIGVEKTDCNRQRIRGSDSPLIDPLESDGCRRNDGRGKLILPEQTAAERYRYPRQEAK